MREWKSIIIILGPIPQTPHTMGGIGMSEEVFVEWLNTFLLGWTNLGFEEWSLLKEVYEEYDNTGKDI